MKRILYTTILAASLLVANSFGQSDEKPKTVRITDGSWTYTATMPTDQYVLLEEFTMVFPSTTSNTFTMILVRGDSTNGYPSVIESAQSNAMVNLRWTDDAGLSLCCGDTLKFTNSANTTEFELTYRLRHPGKPISVREVR